MLMLSDFRGFEEQFKSWDVPCREAWTLWGRARWFSEHIPCECPWFPCLTFNLNSEFPGGLDAQFGERWEGSWRTGCVHMHVAPPAWRLQYTWRNWKNERSWSTWWMWVGMMGGVLWFWSFLSFNKIFQLLNSAKIQRSALNSSGYTLLVLNLLLVSYEKYTFFLCCTVRRKLFCCLQ